jgi:hypothetical protein
LFDPDGGRRKRRTDKHNEMNCRSWQFCERV